MPAINKYVGKVHYTGLIQGWSEMYYLKANTPTGAKTQLSAIIDLRKPMLSDQVEVTFANVSDLGIKRDSYCALETPVNGDSTVSTWVPNSDNDAIQIRLETADGKHADKYIHGVPDGVVVNNQYDPAALTGAWETLLTALRAGLITNTGHLTKVNPEDPTTWTIADYTSTFNRGYTQRKTGRPFDLRVGRRKAGG